MRASWAVRARSGRGTCGRGLRRKQQLGRGVRALVGWQARGGLVPGLVVLDLNWILVQMGLGGFGFNRAGFDLGSVWVRAGLGLDRVSRLGLEVRARI